MALVLGGEGGGWGWHGDGESMGRAGKVWVGIGGLQRVAEGWAGLKRDEDGMGIGTGVGAPPIFAL